MDRARRRHARHAGASLPQARRQLHGQWRDHRGRRLIRATEAASDATPIEPEPTAFGGLLVRQAPVLGWRTYNFTVQRLHTYVAAGKRVHNDCLNPGEELLPATLQLTENGYSVDVINPVTGLVSTIAHSFNPVTQQFSDLTRTTYLADIDAYLNAEWGSLSEAGLPIGGAIDAAANDNAGAYQMRVASV